MPTTDAEFMRLAIAQARAGIAQGQTPFGAVIVRGAEVLAAAHNTVWCDTDPTAHAEVNALRQAARALATIDLHECTLFSTCEPCPMCLAATHWAKVDRLVHGATIEDAAGAGFSEMRVAARTLVEMGGSPLRIESGLLVEECRALFQEWRKRKLSKPY
jgi:guanine deaminase